MHPFLSKATRKEVHDTTNYAVHHLEALILLRQNFSNSINGEEDKNIGVI